MNIISETLQSHIKITNNFYNNYKSNSTNNQSTPKSSVSFLANSREYIDFTGHLVVSWMWLKQGIISYKKLSSPLKDELPIWEQNFYVGKIATLDYYCNIELIKAKSSIQILEKNPQIHNLFSPEWY